MNKFRITVFHGRDDMEGERGVALHVIPVSRPLFTDEFDGLRKPIVAFVIYCDEGDEDDDIPEYNTAAMTSYGVMLGVGAVDIWSEERS